MSRERRRAGFAAGELPRRCWAGARAPPRHRRVSCRGEHRPRGKRARSSTDDTAARSTSVRATVVTGILRQVIPSRRCMRRDRRVLTPLVRRFVGTVTSGAGGAPLTRPSRWAAARPLQQRSLATSSHSREVARLETPRPVSHPIHPRYSRSKVPLRTRCLISSELIPMRTSCERVTTPCDSPAIRASSLSTVVRFGCTATASDRLPNRPWRTL